eukprot:199447_1
MAASIQLETEYHQMDAETINEPPPWSWLDKFILFNFMYTPIVPSGSQRNKCLSIVCVSISTLVTIYLLGWFIYYIIVVPNIVDANALIIQLLETVSIVFRFYYFYYQFNYPWHQSLPQFAKTIPKEYRQYKILAIISLIAIYAACIQWFIHMILIMKTNEFSGLYNPIGQMCRSIFLYIPSILTIHVHISLCVNYQRHLSHLTNVLQNKLNNNRSGDISMKKFLGKYKSLYKSFRISYPISLKFAIQFYLLARLLGLWMVTYFIFETFDKQWLMYFVLIPYQMFVFAISTTLLNEQYIEFKKQLWLFGEKCLNQTNDMSTINKDYYNYVLHFVDEYPFIIKIGKKKITKKK